MAATPSNVRWRVAAIDQGGLPWCIPLPDDSSVDELRRAVEIRENMQRREAGAPEIVVGIQLRLDGELCAVYPTDVLLDLVPQHTKDAKFLAIRNGGEDGVVSNLPPSRAAAAAAKVEAAGAGWLTATKPEPMEQPPTGSKTSVHVPFPTNLGSSHERAAGAAAGLEGISREAMATDFHYSTAGLRALSPRSSPLSSVVAMAVEAAGRAGLGRLHDPPNSRRVLLPDGPAPSRAVSAAIEAAEKAALLERAQPSPDPMASPSFSIDQQHYCVQLHEAAEVQQTGTGPNGGEMEQELAVSSPPAPGKSGRGASSSGSDKDTCTLSVASIRTGEGKKSSCEACHKVFIPSLRPSFCCRTCRKLFHGDCAGYARHKRQCPPPDWICPCCLNGERGPTDYDIHSSLRGKGSVKQTLGNQLWCPICLEDDRAPGSTKNDPGSKKCPDCGLRAHSHCMSELEVRPGGRWPCHECQRRQDRVAPGNTPVWLRLKTARLDGGPASFSKPTQALLSCSDDEERLVLQEKHFTSDCA